MKRLIILALALVLAISLLAACGGGSNPAAPDNGGGYEQSETDTEENVETPEPEAAETPSEEPDVGTVADFLALFGLTEDDIKPEHFVEFGELTADGDKKLGTTGSAGFIQIAVDKDATGEPQVRAWFEKIYGKMQQLSSDGKLYTNFITMEKESTLEDLFNGILWEQFPGTMWAYRYKGGSGEITVNVSTSYRYEDGVYKMSISVF